jgi:phage terminase large subunit
MSITCNNGYQILFAGLDNPLSLQGVKPKKGVITDLWVDEATEIERDDLKILSKRLRGGDDATRKRKIFSFNPIMKNHWIYDEYFSTIGWADKQTEYQTPELSILKTWYVHNKFMTEQDIESLLNEKDEYYKNVYAFGEWGVLGDVIFTNWRVEDLSEMLPEAQRTNRRNGLDFGFSKDPAAVGVSHYDKTRRIIYFYKELYETGLTNDILAERVKDMIGSDTIICDSAEPKSIAELNNHGVNAIGARKGKDSVNFGIDWLKQQTIIVDKSCVNLQNELSQYHWKKDAGGNSLKIPVDKNNHLIDGGLRYAYEGDMSGGVSELVDNPWG